MRCWTEATAQRGRRGIIFHACFPFEIPDIIKAKKQHDLSLSWSSNGRPARKLLTAAAQIRTQTSETETEDCVRVGQFCFWTERRLNTLPVRVRVRVPCQLRCGDVDILMEMRIRILYNARLGLRHTDSDSGLYRAGRQGEKLLLAHGD